MEHCHQSLPEPWRVELRRGLEILRSGQFGQAEEHFARAYRLAPDRAEVCYALGRERQRRGRSLEAELLLRRAWDSDQTLLCAGLALARCLGLQLNRTEEAFAILDQACVDATTDDAASIDVVRAELNLERSDYTGARRAATRARKASRPGSATRAAAEAALARVENQRGVELSAAGNETAALFAFKRAADLDGEWGAPLVNIGVAFARMGRHRAAREAYVRAIARDPENASGHANLGRLLLVGGLTRKARDSLRRAVALAPRDAEFRVALAEAELRSGNFEAARLALRRAIALDSGHATARLRLVDLLIEEGDYIEAAALFASSRPMTREKE